MFDVAAADGENGTVVQPDEIDGSVKLLPTDELTPDQFCAAYDAAEKASLRTINLLGAVHMNIFQMHLLRSASPAAFMLYCQRKEAASAAE